MLQLLDRPGLLIILIFCLMFALTLHEFGHAYVAFICGDRTAQLAGRLTINPMAHLDLFGSLMLIIVGFGYAKPVPVNPRNFKFRNSDFLIAAAGPGMNFILTLIGAMVWRFLDQSGALTSFEFPVSKLLFYFMFINMNLCLFNLIPLGPLDGSYVLPHFLPTDLKRKYQIWNLKYGNQAIIALLLLSYAIHSWSPFRWIGAFSQSMILHLIQ